MGDNRAPEWDDGANGATDEEPRFPEWDDSEYDPNNLPDWSLEAELEQHQADLDDTSQISTKQFDEFVAKLDERLSEDIGYASEQGSIDTLVRMFVGDRPNYARAEQILRQYKLLSLVRATVRQRARQVSNVQAVPGGGEALDLVRIKMQLPDAPVHPDAVVPASWIVMGDDGGVRTYRLVKKIVKRKDGEFYTEHVGVAYNPIVISATMIGVADASANLRISWMARGKWRHRVVARDKLIQPREMMAALGGTHGFPANVNNAKDIIAYLADYEAFNEEVIPTRPMTSQMGWQGRNHELGFVAGRQHLKSDADAPDVHFVGADDGEEQLARCVRSEGNLDEWSDAIKLTSHFPMVEVAVYAALAPPLLAILKSPNFTVDWAHKTSAGKTTALSVAASCWGNPDPNAADSLITSWDMTNVGFERRAAALSCLPMIVDDSKRARTYRGESVVPSIVYAITNGQGRARGSVKGMQATAYWRTVMLSTGESRLIDFDKSGGTPARVVTLWGNPFGGNNQMISETIRKLKAVLMRNFGLAGPAMVQWLLDNQDRWPELRQEYDTKWTELRDRMVKEAAGKTMDMSVMDRVAGNLAVLDVTAQVAHQALELPWVLEDVIGELIPVITPAAGAVDRELEALRAAISWASRNRAKFCYNEKHRREAEPNGGWLGFWEAGSEDTWEFLAFYPGALRDFLHGQGFEPQAIIRQWHEAGWLDTNEPKRMTGRVRELGGRPRMVILPRHVVEGPGDLSTGTAADPDQEEIPF